jgi:hypothetical protein
LCHIAEIGRGPLLLSGAAEDIADVLVAVAGDAGPYALLLGIFIITACFGQLDPISSTTLTTLI